MEKQTDPKYLKSKGMSIVGRLKGKELIQKIKMLYRKDWSMKDTFRKLKTIKLFKMFMLKLLYFCFFQHNKWKISQKNKENQLHTGWFFITASQGWDGIIGIAYVLFLLPSSFLVFRRRTENCCICTSPHESNLNCRKT